MITGVELYVAANWGGRGGGILSKYMKSSHLTFKVQGKVKVTPFH